MRKLVFLTALLGLNLSAAEPIPAQPMEIAQQQVQRLARTILNQEQQLNQLQQEIRQLRGDNEATHHQLEQLTEQQRNFYSDLDERLRKLETGQIPPTPLDENALPPDETVPAEEANKPEAEATDATTPEAETKDPAKQPESETETPATEDEAQAKKADVPTLPAERGKNEKTDYQEAFNLLQQGKELEATQLFQDFLQKYPAGEYADNAQYWLAEAHYSMSDFRSALAEFNSVLENYPNSKKQAHALLKIGFCHYELRDRKRAKAILESVLERFPDTATARLAEQRLQRMQQDNWQ